MKGELVEDLLLESRWLWDPDADPELAAVRLAILLEDVLDITLTDDEIDPAVLSDARAVADLLTCRSGAG
jgi:hypothetical protein